MSAAHRLAAGLAEDLHGGPPVLLVVAHESAPAFFALLARLPASALDDLPLGWRAARALRRESSMVVVATSEDVVVVSGIKAIEFEERAERRRKARTSC